MRASPTTVPHIHRIEARPRGPDQPTIASVAGRSPDRARLRATGATARGGSAADAAGERADERAEDDQGQGRRVRLAGAGAG